MTLTSRHYTDERQEREKAILKIGLGDVIHAEVHFDKSRNRSYRYEITSTAILIVKALDRDLIVTKYPARPSRIKKYWTEESAARQNVLAKSYENTQRGLTF